MNQKIVIEKIVPEDIFLQWEAPLLRKSHVLEIPLKGQEFKPGQSGKECSNTGLTRGLPLFFSPPPPCYFLSPSSSTLWIEDPKGKEWLRWRRFKKQDIFSPYTQSLITEQSATEIIRKIYDWSLNKIKLDHSILYV